MLIMTSEDVNEVKNEEATKIIANVINEEAAKETNNEENNEEINEEINEEVSQPQEEKIPIAKAKPKAVPKKLARSVKVVELVECNDCGKKMLPKSLRNTHPYYCKGQPTETLPVNRQKASYGTKVEQKLRKEIEDEMRQKYEIKTKEVEPTIKQSDLNEVAQSRESLSSVANAHEALSSVANAHEALPSVKTKPKPVKIIESETPPKQLTATELLQQSYNEMKRLRQQEKQEKINKFKSSMF